MKILYFLKKPLFSRIYYKINNIIKIKKKNYFQPANLTFDPQILLSTRKFLLSTRKCYFRPANQIYGKYMRLSGAKGGHFGQVWNKLYFHRFNLRIQSKKIIVSRKISRKIIWELVNFSKKISDCKSNTALPNPSESRVRDMQSQKKNAPPERTRIDIEQENEGVASVESSEIKTASARCDPLNSWGTYSLPPLLLLTVNRERERE